MRLSEADLPAADPAIEALVRDELAALAELEGEAQEAALPGLLQRVQERAAAERVPFEDGYQFGDVSKTVLEATRGEVTRQLDADWDMRDVSLLLRVGLFLGAGAAAPVAGLAAMPVAALLATYGAALKLELGGRAVQEVTVRVGERAAQGIADGVKSYTGKEEYQFGDLTTATVRKATGNEDYEFGDLTKGALKKMAGNGIIEPIDKPHSFAAAESLPRGASCSWPPRERRVRRLAKGHRLPVGVWARLGD